MTQIGFDLKDAHEALDQFLNGERMERWIGDEKGHPVAYIVAAEAMDEMRNGYSEWLDSQEVHEELAGQPAGYKPWIHSPLATTDRLLPHEPLDEVLAHAMFQKPLGELDERERDRVMYMSIACLLRVTLDPDGQGAVPILMRGHDEDEPGRSLRWQIAYATGVPGLFVRVTANSFLGEEFGILTGSGYRLASGWYSREDASAAVDALGRVLPNADWMRMGPGGFTPKASAALKAVIQRYHQFGLQDDKPEPEPVTDAMPAEGETAKAGVSQ